MAPGPFVIVSRPSFTVTVAVASNQRVELLGVPLSTSSTFGVQSEDAVEVSRVARDDAHRVRPVRERDLPARVRVRRLLQVGERVVALVGGVRGVAVARLRRVVGVPAEALASRAKPEDRSRVREIAGRALAAPAGWKLIRAPKREPSADCGMTAFGTEGPLHSSRATASPPRS